MLSRFEEVVKQSSDMEKEFGSVLLNHEKEVSEFKKQQRLFLSRKVICSVSIK